ncbi:MAG: hypothetical protein ABUK01_10690 [Leptospirales bacterium]
MLKTTKKLTIFAFLVPLVFTWNCPANDGPHTKITKVDFSSNLIGEGEINSDNEYHIDNTPQETSYDSLLMEVDAATISLYTNRAGPGLGVSWQTNDSNTTGVSCGVSYEYYVVIIKQDNITLYASEYSIYTIAGNNAGIAEIPLNFTDQTYATAETHTYTFEFWQCKGACELKDYDKKTKKKEEFTITVNYTP